jgi:hypothetical protein
MKLSKSQRAEVVELLRCAADERADGIGLNGMFDTANWLDLSGDKQDAAWSAINALPFVPERCVVVGIVDEVYRLALLEAAQRVSDEEWP